ncbi:hypothetical protein GCM10027167_23970 [Nocardia heshunensis]
MVRIMDEAKASRQQWSVDAKIAKWAARNGYGGPITYGPTGFKELRTAFPDNRRGPLTPSVTPSNVSLFSRYNRPDSWSATANT